MTGPVISKNYVWCLRLLASAFALWAIYRNLLRPDWSVRITVGSEVFDTYERFWLWESPEPSAHGGLLGGIRWGESLVRLAGSLLGVCVAWCIPFRSDCFQRLPSKPKQPTSAPSGAGGERRGSDSPVSLPCPACGYRTVPDAFFGSYNLCRVCGWEDDGAQLANPACGGGANTESLIEAQAKALAVFPLGLTEACGSSRDSAWRPMSDEEIKVALRERQDSYWRNKAVVDPSAAYWNRLSNKA